MTTRRKLSTGDSGDFEIPLDTPFDLGYAYNLASSSVTQVHSSKDSMSLTVLSDGVSSFAGAFLMTAGVSAAAIALALF